MGSVLLFALLLGLLCASYVLFDRRIDSPAFVFVLFFALSIGSGLLNYVPYAFDLHPNTVGLIGGGAVIFVAVAWSVRLVWRKRVAAATIDGAQGDADDDPLIAEPLHVPVVFYVLGLLLACGTAWVMLKSYTELSIAHGGPTDLLGVMREYDKLAKFSDVDVSIRGIPGHIIAIGDGAYYIWAYLFAQNLNARRRTINWWALLIMGVTMAYTLLSGERNGIILRLLAFAFMYLNFWYRRRRTTGRPNVRVFAAIAIVIVVGMLAFRPMLALMGRGYDNKYSLSEYVSRYLGAPVKNLDMYLNDELPHPITVKSERWGEQTFAVAYASLDHWAGHDAPKKWNDWQPFQELNGRKLGNVYTIYYTFAFDWGYAGALVATAVLAALSELCFLLSCTRRVLGNGAIKTSVLVYGIVGYGLCFCFFLNFVVKAVVNTGFVRMAATWLLASFVLKFANERLTTGAERAED